MNCLKLEQLPAEQAPLVCLQELEQRSVWCASWELSVAVYSSISAGIREVFWRLASLLDVSQHSWSPTEELFVMCQKLKLLHHVPWAGWP